MTAPVLGATNAATTFSSGAGRKARQSPSTPRTKTTLPEAPSAISLFSRRYQRPPIKKLGAAPVASEPNQPNWLASATRADVTGVSTAQAGGSSACAVVEKAA